MPTIVAANSYFEPAIGETSSRLPLSTGLTGGSTIAITRWTNNADSPNRRLRPVPRIVIQYTLTSGDMNPGRAWRLEKPGTRTWKGPWRTTAGTYTETVPISSLGTLVTGESAAIANLVLVVYSGGVSDPGPGVEDSATYRSVKFATNRRPDTPVITGPANNITVPYNDTPSTSLVRIDWSTSDPDNLSSPPSDDYGGWEVQYRYQSGAGWTNWATYTMGRKYTAFGTHRPTESWQIDGYADALDPPGYDKVAFYYDKHTHVLAGPTSWGFGTLNTAVRISPGSYQFRVRSYDESAYNRTPYNSNENMRSEWSLPVTIHVTASFLPPTPLSPVNDIAVWGDTIEFRWQFRDPRTTGGTQLARRLRVRKFGEGEGDWVEIIPSANWTSPDMTWVHANDGSGYVFDPGFRYEWQALTYSTPGSHMSTWSDSAYFWFIPAPSSGPELPTPTVTFPDPGLGCGLNRAFVYRRGGLVPLGEILKPTKIDWARVRDDISSCTITVSLANAESEKCAPLLANLRSWLHEIVVFRDSGQGSHRVWEGPVTRITYTNNGVSIEARDVMIYPYRRIMRLGYNDAFRLVGRRYDDDGNIIVPGQVLNEPQRVTIRSSRILQNALAYDDPNVLPYLTLLDRADDAKQSRVVPEFSRTSWQEVDDLAAKAGLDYTTVGRRILLWDTHTPIGQLPEMRDGDFDTSPVVTEYGMQAANVYAVTNNGGVYGIANREDMRDEYGYIEMLSSAYGESDEAASDVALTEEARQKLEETLTEQAERNISSRWPVPVVVRIPDNSTLSPDIGVTINQLIPGVHIPLRSTSTLRHVAQMQKLDSMRCVQDESGETVTVTMSPAPRSRDEDVDAGGEE